MRDNDTLAVRNRSRASILIGLVSGHLFGVCDRLLPEFLPRCSIKTVQGAFHSFFDGAGEEHFAAGNNRAAIAGSWKGHFPQDVFVGSPLSGHSSFRRSSIVVWTSEGMPVSSDEVGCQKYECERRDTDRFHEKRMNNFSRNRKLKFLTRRLETFS